MAFTKNRDWVVETDGEPPVVSNRHRTKNTVLLDGPQGEYFGWEGENGELYAGALVTPNAATLAERAAKATELSELAAKTTTKNNNRAVLSAKRQNGSALTVADLAVLADDVLDVQGDVPNPEEGFLALGLHGAKINNLFANNLNSSETLTQVGFWDVSSLYQTHANDSYTATVDGVAVPEDGTYLISYGVYITSQSPRSAVGIQATVNGAVRSERSGGSYIRVNQGHNESSVDGPSRLYSLTMGDVISLARVRLANSGAVVAPAGQSFLNIYKVS